jgi:DNA modification methylase
VSTWEIREGDCIEVMAAMDEGSVDAIVTDPPYGIGFMGHEWDQPTVAARANGVVSTFGRGHRKPSRSASVVAGEYDLSLTANQRFQAWCEAWAREARRVLKPGGHMLVSGGTRTFHRLTCGLEDAGFEIRDCLSWLYGSGFPKSLNLDGEHRGWGTALKPAWEPIMVARKPLAGTVAANMLEHGLGAINVEGCRLGQGDGGDRLGEPSADRRYSADGSTDFAATPGPRGGAAEGRWPPNVALGHTEDCKQIGERRVKPANGSGRSSGLRGGFRSEYVGGDASEGVFAGGHVDENGYETVEAWHCTPDCPVRMLDEQSGELTSARGAETGGASRFLFCAKTRRSERNAGLEGFEERKPHDNAGHKHAAGRAWDIPGSHSTARANYHPTVKPIRLMRWLVRLVTPPGGLVLDPFTGSGSTGCAAVLEGFRFLGVEREPDYLPIARARIAWWAEHPEGLGLEVALQSAARQRQAAEAGQSRLFDTLEPA